MPDIKRTFSMRDLMTEPFRGASDVPHKAIKEHRGIGEAVGQVRRDRRRTKEQSEQLIREFMQAQTQPVLFLDILDYLERRESPVLRQIVNDLVASGELIKTEDWGAGPLLPRHLYEVRR